ncbi:hypothetical protein [Acinetobacter sp.]|uniref:hypothetical protein n=1 Tax=Acinetobacter sp. TaxID=472 RepID=UPI003CFFD078
MALLSGKQIKNGTIQLEKLHAEVLAAIQAGDKYYEHNQVASNSIWTVTHNLNKKPSVMIVDSADSMIVPNEISYVDLNTIQVSFTAPMSGKAYCQ